MEANGVAQRGAAALVSGDSRQAAVQMNENEEDEED